MKKGLKILFMELLRLALGMFAIALALFALFWIAKGIGWIANWYQEVALEIWGLIRQNPSKVIGVVGLILLGAILSRVWDKILAMRKKGE